MALPPEERKKRRAASVRKWNEKNPDYNKRWKKANREKTYRNNRASALRRSYGISLEQYDEMLSKQKGKCAICGTEEPSNHGVFVVDHDHKTGKVRGLLCDSCNVGLGRFGDDADRLECAAKYLRTAC